MNNDNDNKNEVSVESENSGIENKNTVVGSENEGTEPKKSGKSDSRIIAIKVLFGVAVFMTIACLVISPTSFLFFLGPIVLAVAIIGGCLYLSVFLDKKYGKDRLLTMPMVALSLHLMSIIFYFLTRTGFSLFFVLGSLLAAFFGVLLGITAICDWRRMGKPARILSIIAIAFPVATVVIVLLLASMNVIVITLM